jgi:predicted DNA-binding transcriptional regulator YafY
MAPLKDTRRLLLIFGLLAKDGTALTVRQIRAKLPSAYRTHVRSIQRDLANLKRWAPLVVDRASKPYLWRIKPDAICPCCRGRLDRTP